MDVQVRFNDYDMFCHLNNGAYMQFLDLGKTDYFGSLLGGVLTPERLSIVVAGITCNFVEPSLPGQRVRVLTRALHLATASLLFAQQVIDFYDLAILDENGGRVPRKADLRAFVLTGSETQVWPSGLTRFSRNPNSFIVNSSQGGGFKDTWVLSR